MRVESGSAFLRIFGLRDPAYVSGGDPPVERHPLEPSEWLGARLADDAVSGARYNRFAVKDSQADALRSIGTWLVFASGIAMLIRQDTSGWPMATAWAGVGFRLGSEIPAARARSELREAINAYDTSLENRLQNSLGINGAH